MDPRRRAAYLRLAIVCAAWALGDVLVRLFAPGLGLVVPALLGAAAYIATGEVISGGGDGGEPMYWRGRRIDKGRWDR